MIYKHVYVRGEHDTTTTGEPYAFNLYTPPREQHSVTDKAATAALFASSPPEPHVGITGLNFNVRPTAIIRTRRLVYTYNVILCNTRLV